MKTFFCTADERVEDTVDQRHPLPNGPGRTLGGDHDFVPYLPGGRIDQFARFVVRQIQQFGCGDHRIPMDYEPFCQRPLPENCTVERIGAYQLIEPPVLIRLMCNVAKRAKDSSARRHRHLRHGAEQRFGKELRHRRSDIFCQEPP